MTNERLMQFFISAMAVLSTVMLGTSQENRILPLVALLAASLSLVFTDWLRWFSLHPILAGVLGLIAGIYAFVQSQSSTLADQFVSVANLLIHLQLILLFQKKSIRIYWQLITLSLLQVVVAAALNLFVFFGPLLVLYTGCAMCAMIQFFIHRETFSLFEPASETSKQEVIEVESHSRFQFTAEHAKTRRRLFKTTGFRSFAMLAVSTVVMSLSVFLLMPRFGDGVWRPNNKKVTATGFDGDSVDLSDVGSLYENPAIVMRVSFTTDSVHGEQLPYVINGIPYLRGTALEEYKYGRGRWTRHHDLQDRDFSAMPRPQRITSAVKQTVALEIPKKGVVFSLPPAVSLEDTSTSLRSVERTNEVRYFPDADEDAASYSLGTTSLTNGTQSQFSPMLRSLSVNNESRRRVYIERNMPELKALAEGIVRDIPAENTLERARMLERHFTNRANGFKYSLDGPGERKPELDPVVDFAINHKTGHCQYYASALALMLRSIEIPSRVVIGYRCDNYNVVGNYYQVREMDAHAWVEAAIAQDQLPNEIMPQESIPGDAWMRLDPTPSENVSMAQVQISPWRAQLNDTMDYMQLLWSEYVLGLNERRQRRRIYEPIQDFFKTTTALAFSPDIWIARWEAFLARFQGDLFRRENIRDSSIAVTVLIMSFFAIRWIWKMLRGSVSRMRKRNRSRGPRVDFYLKFEKMLAKHGLRREEQQTPREFAEIVERRLLHLGSEKAVGSTTTGAEIPLSDIPRAAVDSFYRVRFGNDRLDTDEAERLENSLGRLQQFLAATPN